MITFGDVLLTIMWVAGFCLFFEKVIFKKLSGTFWDEWRAGESVWRHMPNPRAFFILFYAVLGVFIVLLKHYTEVNLILAIILVASFAFITGNLYVRHIGKKYLEKNK